MSKIREQEIKLNGMERVYKGHLRRDQNEVKKEQYEYSEPESKLKEE